MSQLKEILPTANFQVTETWTVECPHCSHEQDAPFNDANPMRPLEQFCEKCGQEFVLTYEREC